MKISDQSTIYDLVQAIPGLRGDLVAISPKYENLNNPVIFNTMARVAKLETAAAIAGVPLVALLRAVRQSAMKQIIRELHDGLAEDEATRRFGELIGDIDAAEIAAMEQALMAEGLPAAEIKRLCHVHTRVFKEALAAKAAADPVRAGKPFGVAPDHPLHPFVAWNRSQEEILERLEHELELIAAPDCGADEACASCGVDHGAESSTLSQLASAPDEAGNPAVVVSVGMFELGWKDIDRLLSWLAANDDHYRRKENALFPLLEKHGVSAPTQVMWAVQDDIRAQLKLCRAELEAHRALEFVEAALDLMKAIRELIYKEENILYPLSLEKLDAADWQVLAASYESAGYRPSSAAHGLSSGAEPKTGAVPAPEEPAGGLINLDTGRLQPDQINLILKNLAVDVSFVDENDTVAYYSDGPHRIFPRSPSVIGRKVQFCHPPKSVHTVQKILDDFRSGARGEADFWLELHGKFIYIRYTALRDADGTYRGCLEASQDLTALRALEGEKRLME